MENPTVLLNLPLEVWAEAIAAGVKRADDLDKESWRQYGLDAAPEERVGGILEASLEVLGFEVNVIG